MYFSSQCSTTGVTKAMVCVILSGMVHIKEPLLLIDKSSLCGSSVFPFSLSEWSLTCVCVIPFDGAVELFPVPTIALQLVIKDHGMYCPVCRMCI